MRLVLLLSGLILAGLGFGQTTIAIQDFEVTPATPTLTYSGSPTIESGNTGTSWFPNNSDYNSTAGGSRCWTRSGTTSFSLDFTSTDISGYENVSIDFNYAGFAGASGNGIDAGDALYVAISLDGGTSFSQEVEINGSTSNRKWGFDAGGTNTHTYDGDDSYTIFTSSNTGPSKMVINIPNTRSGNDLVIRIDLDINNVDEKWAVDDIEIKGIPACTPPTTQATNFSASSITTNSMNVNWDDGNGDRVLVIARDLSAVDAVPISRTSYTANANFGDGDEIGTGNFVIYDGAGTSPGSSSVNVMGLNPGITYHFAIYSYNSVDNCYNLDELTGSATTSGPDIQLQYPINTDVDCGNLTIDFGNHEAGVGTNSLSFRIENTGDADLTLTLPLTIGGTNAGDYTITAQPSGTIGASSFSDVTVEFAPSAIGTRTATIDITSDDVDENPCSVSLTGVGTIANDECSAAISLTVNSDETCTSSTSGTTVGASDSGLGAILCNGSTGNANDDAWFSFVATATAHSVLVTAGAGFNAVLDIRSGVCNGTNIECADDNGAGGDEEVEVSGLTIGATYYVRIYSFGTTAGTFDVCIATPPPPANPGDVVINEFMAAPSCAADADAEYVELYNTTTSPIDIDGWTLSDDGSDSHSFSSANGTTTIPAGGYLLCARASNDTYFGFTPAYVYSSFILADSGDEIVLKDGSTEVCRVNYTDGKPFGAGISLQLPENYDYDNANDGVILASEYIEPNSVFGCGDFGTPNAENILPVSLLSFTAKALSSEVQLIFTTATEENNSHFLIQRSADGKVFEAIGRIEGKGNSDQAVSYQYTDTKPLTGINYYRLQQFDFDGANEFFGPVAVRFKDATASAPSIWPVPANDRLEINLPDIDSNEWLIEVYDLNGRLMLQQNLEEKTISTTLDVGHLAAGTYLFRWINGQQYGQKRFVKQ